MSTRALLGSVLATVFVTGGVLLACGTNRSGYDEGASSGGASSSSGGSSSGTFGEGDAGDASVKPPVLGWLTGKVVAPEGTVPVSNAMVYLTAKSPEAIPQNAYCDTCVKLSPLEPYAYSKSDGTFDLAVYATGKQYLVVQKGQFRRVREIDVPAGDSPVPAELTRLPSKNDAAKGDTIPKIAMVVGGYDHIDYSMKKLGVEEFYRYGDGPINIGPTPPGTKTGKSGNALMGSAAEMGGYHIVLMPCAAFGFNNSGGDKVCGSPSSGQQAALKGYVEGGGKVYVTDYSYEAVRQTWPGFVTFYDSKMQPLASGTQGLGTACRGGAEDTNGTAQDPGLKSWMDTIGEKNIQLKASWSRIQKVSPQPGVDAKGAPVTITPKVWMTSNVGGAELPATVSFEQKCGRVLFSTYHCEGDDSSKLLAQEKALLYILLEVGVCVGELPPPPPPR